MGSWKKQTEREAILKHDLLGKGHAHKVEHCVPQVCPDCKGSGYTNTGMECWTCGGEGSILGVE